MTTEAVLHRDVLTQAEARARATRVSNTGYQLSLDISRGAETYRGEVTITFDLTGRGSIFLDHRGKTIHRLTVNGTPVEPDWTGFRLTLPGDTLQQDNVVTIVYENDYDHGGDGFHQFKDPEDGEEYLYSNFEPYEAHRLFPCFDQPDIKATYQLTVTAPTEWEIIANSRQFAATALGDGRTRRQFEQTRPFSTYLFALIAGPYHATTAMHGDIPIGLYCRKSLVRYLDAENIFEITRQGLEFYAQFFDLAYPFGKYDQVFVPEFNSGAMENVGAITHNEYMIYRDPPTENQRRRRAETILHEMAHMWFGDLVTMRWWNDLWLNESFATYMSYLSMTSATRFTTGWQDFNAAIKSWAYRQDQLVTTHPIAGQVADTEQTFQNFDGITYGKGASVIKQLVATIGMDGFQEGMRHYFRTHAYGNATLAQFLASLEAGSGKDLKDWSKAWLETASLNTIAARWEADGDRLTKLSLLQTAPADYPTIRPHQMEIGLLHENAGRIAVTSLPASIATAEADVALPSGLAKPALVFPNYNDHDYAKVTLDAESVAFVTAKMEHIDNPMLRQLLWSSLWDMVRDQRLKSTNFLRLVAQKLPLEPEISLLDPVLGQAMAAVSRYVPAEWREREAHTLFLGVLAALRAAPKGDAQIIWARSLIGSAIVPEDIEFLGRLADGTENIAGLVIDQDMRWSIATRFVGYGLAGAAARIAAEARRDPSDRGQRARLRAETSVPDAAIKASAWEKFLGDGYGSFHLTRAAMEGFNWTCQRNLLEPYVERFFEAVPGVFRRDDITFAENYFGALFPGYRIERPILERSQRLLAETPADMPALARVIRETIDDLDRAIKCREFAAS